jgi:hypothetical protein
MKYYRVSYDSFHTSYSVIVVADDKSKAIIKYVNHVQKVYPKQEYLTDNIRVDFVCTEGNIIR